MRRRNESGVTFIELLVALGIVGVLAGIMIPSFAVFKRRAAKVSCISHMRAIHVGFDAYMQDYNKWPQMPARAIGFDETEFFGWWINILEPYGAGEAHWLCPLDKVQLDNSKKKKEYAGSYIPTMFDSHSFTPLRWNQPWLLERGDFHGQGAHVMMPDGSVFESTNPYGK